MSIPTKIITSLAFFFFIATLVTMANNQSTATFSIKQAIAQQTTLVSTGHSDQTDDSDSDGIFTFTMDDIDGKPLPLNQFKGQVIMVVNTASFCGNTPQYSGLQTLYERYRDQGFTILAFPANDFGKQEPGSNEEIADFCYTKYALEFPLFSKITVLGENKTSALPVLDREVSLQREKFPGTFRNF